MPIDAVLLGCAALVVAGITSGSRVLEGIRTTDRVEVIAHRGGAASRPENTMAAIEQGIEDGADWTEIDVKETSDGEVVVFHDSDFMRLAQVNRKILHEGMRSAGAHGAEERAARRGARAGYTCPECARRFDARRPTGLFAGLPAPRLATAHMGLARLHHLRQALRAE